MNDKSVCQLVHKVVSDYLSTSPFEFKVTLERVCISVSGFSCHHLPCVEIVIGTQTETQCKVASMGIITALHKTGAIPHNIRQSVNFCVTPVRPFGGRYLPMAEEIIHRESKRGEMFTVMWNDDTSTTVKLKEGESSDEYTAYLYALGKKIFEDKGKARAFIREKKKVFEDRVEYKRAEKERKLKAKQLQKEMEESEVADISDLVYEDMFVAPALISRSIFKRNKDSN